MAAKVPAGGMNLDERPILVASHLVPSIPIGLFELFVEAVEAATGSKAALLYEPRTDRGVAPQADIAILPANEEWKEGTLLPVSFSFKHPLNKECSASVYVDVVVASDHAEHVQDILDLRGHRCSIPDRGKRLGAASLLFKHLRSRGEGPSFFGNTLDAETQLATLEMVRGKQAEVGVLESPVIRSNQDSESVHTILTSLGPLPPYRIMANKSLPNAVVKKITEFLAEPPRQVSERFRKFGVEKFGRNSEEFYRGENSECVVTAVPYY